ncbi:protein of unknown function [Pseudomonas sp. JV551A1]|uniref:Uncharacterized protein n=1 Tax=Pseudomonas inefficax TaxID=2078786 RepID=A0AAQ1SVA1_9PSED|nr:protein of unknown function [Pseudomonas sp. JV551A1]SPO62097.1 protein of unknown function [Pseudomonas inefficax]
MHSMVWSPYGLGLDNSVLPGRREKRRRHQDARLLAREQGRDFAYVVPEAFIGQQRRTALITFSEVGVGPQMNDLIEPTYFAAVVPHHAPQNALLDRQAFCLVQGQVLMHLPWVGGVDAVLDDHFDLTPFSMT